MYNYDKKNSKEHLFAQKNGKKFDKNETSIFDIISVLHIFI